MTSQFAGQGVTFGNTVTLSAGVSLNEFEFPPRSNFNVISDDGGPIAIFFSLPQSSVLVFLTYAEPIVIDAFDSSNAFLGTVHSAAPCLSNLALSGTSGCLPNEQLTLMGIGSISRLRIAGNGLGGSFVLDDLTFSGNGVSTEVPEPSQQTLLVVGLLGGLLLKSRKIAAGKAGSIARRMTAAGPCLRMTLLVSVVILPVPAVQGIDWLRVDMNAVTVGQSATVVFRTQVGVDQTLVPTSVTLVRYDANGTATQTVGQMTDTGSNGDELAADGIFSLRVTLSENSPSTLVFRSSVAYRGLLRRILSDPVEIFAQVSQTPVQALSALATDLESGNIGGALRRFSPSANNETLLRSMNQSRLNRLATSLRAAVFNRSIDGGAQVFLAPTLTRSGLVPMEVVLRKNERGEWVVVNW